MIMVRFRWECPASEEDYDHDMKYCCLRHRDIDAKVTGVTKPAVEQRPGPR